MTDELADLTVLLLVEKPDDRERLREWLAGTDGLVPSVPTDPTDPLPDLDADGAVDVCLLDVGGARAHGDALAACRESSDTYRPTLLVVPERYGDPESALRDLGCGGEHVDDTVGAPVRRSELARRIRALARARRYSTKLAASRNRFRRLVELLPDAMFVCADGAVTYTNPRARSLLGLTRESIEGRHLIDLAPAAERERVAAMLEEAAVTGRAGPVEAVLARGSERNTGGGTDADGRERGADGIDVGRPGGGVANAVGGASTPGAVPVELTAAAAGGGQVQVLARDLRGRRERERRLALYRRAMDAATVGITIADHTDDGEALIYVNEEFRRLAGRDEDELLGRNPRVLQADETDPDTVARLRAAIDAGEEASVVLLNRRGDGRTWYNALDISPIHGADGEVTHYLGFQRDVTDRVARDQRLTVLDRVLRHNIRNRLNVVLGYAGEIDGAIGAGAGGVGGDDLDGAVAAGTVDVEAVRVAVERIRTAATDLTELADSARRFREDVAAADGDAPPVDAGALLADVVSALAGTHRDAEVRLRTPAEPVHVGGAAPLGLVVDELVTNALEHVPDATVTVSLAGDDGEAVLRVADDGPGITRDSRAPLEQPTETPTEHGQGVGLWLVRWTVEAVGGTVGYEPGPDGGTVVAARFPAVDPGSADGQACGADEGDGRDGMNGEDGRDGGNEADGGTVDGGSR